MTDEGRGSKQRRWTSIAYAIAFVGLLALPLLTAPFFADSERATEKRLAVGFPTLFVGLENFSSEFENWFEDHFGLRSSMIRFYRQLRFELGLGETGINRVVQGKEDWLYLAGGGRSDPLQTYSGANMFAEDELDHLQSYFERWKLWLEAQGSSLYVLIVPNKVSIYPEYLPDRFQRSPYGTRTEQFLERMRVSNVPVVFPITDLIEAKIGGSDLYFKLDTHWNGRGAWIGYSALIRSIDEASQFSVSDFRFVENRRESRDLSDMLGIESAWKDSDFTVELENGEWPVGEGDWMALRGKRYHLSVNDFSLPKVLVVHDSFMGPMARLLARHFLETELVFENSPRKSLVLEIRPDIVIWEFSERNLHQLLSQPIP